MASAALTPFSMLHFHLANAPAGAGAGRCQGQAACGSGVSRPQLQLDHSSTLPAVLMPGQACQISVCM